MALQNMCLVKLKRPVQGEERGTPKSGRLFEGYAELRIRRWFEDFRADLGADCPLTDLQFGLELYDCQNLADFRHLRAPVIGELDCVMVTRTGRLIAIDFKAAGRFGAWREQMFGVEAAGGKFAEMYYLYPWITQDLPPQDPAQDTRPAAIRRRMASISEMDSHLLENPFAGRRKTGIRFVEEESLFRKVLTGTLRLE
jgi:hypothetical protein